MDDVAGGQGARTLLRLDHQVTGIVDPAGQTNDLFAVELHPDLGPERGAARPGALRPGHRARRASPAGGGVEPRAARSASSRTPRSTGGASGRASARQVPPTPGGPGQATLMPMPTTTERTSASANSASASTPASLASASTRSFGHLSLASTPATSLQAWAAARATAAVQRCRSEGSRSRSDQDREEERGTRRGLPAAIEAAPAGRLVIGHRHRSIGGVRPCLLPQVGVGRVDLLEAAHVPVPVPHAGHPRVSQAPTRVAGDRWPHFRPAART